MTNDLQERLRDDFAELAATRLDLGVETHDVIQSGHRTLRARFVRRAVGAGSLALVAAVLAWPSLTMPGISAGPVVPAAPGTSGSLTDAAYFRVDDAGMGNDTDRLEVDVEAAGTGWEVTVIGSRSDGVLTRQWSFHQAAAPSAVQLAPRAILEFLPTRATWSNVVMKDKARAIRYDEMHVGALDLTAGLVWDESPIHVDDVAGFIWEDAGGVIRDSLGNTMPTVGVPLRTQTFEVYWDAHLDALGYQSPGGQLLMSGLARPAGIYPRLIGQIDGVTGGTETRMVLGDVLPKGATDLTVELGSAKAEWGQTQIGGRTVYVVTYPASMAVPITRISYVEANGNPVSLRMP